MALPTWAIPILTLGIRELLAWWREYRQAKREAKK